MRVSYDYGLEARTFELIHPEACEPVGVAAWFHEITGETPEECQGITVGIPLHNERGDLPNLLEQLLAQRIPQEVKYNLIMVSNASTDRTPEKIRQLMDQIAEEHGGKITERTISWPSEEFAEQYRREHWYGEHDNQLDPETITVRELITDDNIHVIHADTPNASKNNALNLVRFLSPTDCILSMDGDIRLHPESIPRLFGALSNQRSNEQYPVAAGCSIPYYDTDNFLTTIRRRQKRPISPGTPRKSIWGGFFAYDRKRIPAFPVDLMYEDRWITEWCKQQYGEMGWAHATQSLGFQRRPSKWGDEREERIRSLVHHEQLLALHPEDLPDNYTTILGHSILDMTRSLLLNSYPSEVPQILREQVELRQFILSWLKNADDLPLLKRVYRLMKAAQQLEVLVAAKRRLLELQNNPNAETRTFPRINSSKARSR